MAPANESFAPVTKYLNRNKEDARLICYTSPPLSQDLEITGYPILNLYVAVSVSDAAFFVYLEDVDPSGHVRYLTEGQLRGLHRRINEENAPYVSHMPYRTYRRDDGEPLPEGKEILLTIGLWPISALIQRGHCLRVALAGADAETFLRIPEQGDVHWRISIGGSSASSISLPVVRR